MNYIKGYRYELYCLARNAMTTMCLVYCDTKRTVAQEWCQKQEESKTEETDCFPVELFEDYANRMEFPNPAKRWD